MESSEADVDALWNQLWELENRINQGENLELTADVRDLLVRAAPTVAISDSEVAAALDNEEAATALLREIRKRIRDGSNRIGDALLEAYAVQGAADLNGARKQLEDVLAVEVVPFYREQAERALDEMTRLAAVGSSGHVDASLQDWVQLPVLLHRVQQGSALELNDGMRAFLRRSAASVAISDAEAEEALASPVSAAALLGKAVRRIREGSERIERALTRMMSLRDAGRLEGARQQMRDVLAVEVVPKFREMAEENLRGLEEPPGAK